VEQNKKRDDNRGKIKMNILPRFTCHHRTAGGVECCDLHARLEHYFFFDFTFEGTAVHVPMMYIQATAATVYKCGHKYYYTCEIILLL